MATGASMFYVEADKLDTSCPLPAPERVAFPPRPGTPVPGTELRVRRVPNLSHAGHQAVEIQSPLGNTETVSMEDLDRRAQTDGTAAAILLAVGG